MDDTLSVKVADLRAIKYAINRARNAVTICNQRVKSPVVKAQTIAIYACLKDADRLLDEYLQLSLFSQAQRA